MVIVSCSGKFHAFNLAEQLEQNNLLTGFYTSFVSFKNTYFSKFVKRQDKEIIPIDKVHTFLPTAFGIKFSNNHFFWNDLFDQYVAAEIKKRDDFEVFVGWSGMALRSIRVAKAKGKKTIVERGSSHILYQEKILKEEYRKFNKDFAIDPRVIERELKEYEEADIISIPSNFVKNTFLEYGIVEAKLFVNPYGVSTYFQRKEVIKPDKFIILYLGSLTIRKGLIYLFEALHQLELSADKFEAWFIGEISNELKETCEKYKKDNWRFFGKISHYDLANYISQCDVMVQPSIEEGLSMVIPQVLSCGVPVIATTNTGGGMVIEDGVNGYIISNYDSVEIADKITYLYNNKAILSGLKDYTLNHVTFSLSWENYGVNYRRLINILINNNE